MQIDYTAKRSVQAGHSIDTPYTINIDLYENDRTFKAHGVENKALNGNTVAVIHRVEETNNLTTVLVSAATSPTVLDMREFLDSVVGGEVFQLDISGVSIDYKLHSMTKPYSERELERSNFRYSFQVRPV